MPLFTIYETVTVTVQVEADTPQEALDSYLTNGDGFDERTESVDDRHVEDESGAVCEVEDK